MSTQSTLMTGAQQRRITFDNFITWSIFGVVLVIVIACTSVIANRLSVSGLSRCW